MIAFVCLAGLVFALLFFVAYVIPENAGKNKLTISVILLVFFSVAAGIGLGSFPTFSSIVRHYVWDEILPGISEVTSSPLGAPVATRENDLITLDNVPKGYKTQVKYFDPATGDPQYELVTDVTYTLPEGAKGVSVRFVKGNLVTKWTELPDPVPTGV